MCVHGGVPPQRGLCFIVGVWHFMCVSHGGGVALALLSVYSEEISFYQGSSRERVTMKQTFEQLVSIYVIQHK